MIEKTPLGSQRLNPFAFPPETNAFFTLLAITAPVWMLELGQTVGRSLGVVKETDFLAIAVSLEEQGLLVMEPEELLLPFTLVLLVVLTAIVIFLSHPLRIRHKKKLRQIVRKDDPKFIDAIQELVELSEVSPSPRIELTTSSPSVDGQAFGLWRNYSIRLGSQFRLLLRQDAGSFQAIILHELAHIANADVSRTYFTQALWIAVIALTVIPALGLLLLPRPRTDMPIDLLFMFKIGGAIIIITAIYSYLLRAREFYADWKAAFWGAERSLTRVLERNIVRKDQGNRWTSLWRLHPTVQERLAVLKDPSELFYVRPVVPFLVGTLPGLMVGGLFSQGKLIILLLAVIGTRLQEVFGADLFNSNWNLILLAFMTFALFAIPGLIITYLITHSLGIAVQRQTIANMAAGQAGWPIYMALWKPALLVAIGYQLGGLLTISSILERIPDLLQRTNGLSYIVLLLLLIITFAFLTWIGLLYVAVFTRQVLGSHIGKSSPKVKMRLLTLVLSGMFLASYIPMVFAQLVIEAAASTGDSVILLQWMPAVMFAEAMTMLIYLLVFALTWLFVGIARITRQSHCSICGQISRQKYSVGQTCEHCGNELAAWLYVT